MRDSDFPDYPNHTTIGSSDDPMGLAQLMGPVERVMMDLHLDPASIDRGTTRVIGAGYRLGSNRDKGQIEVFYVNPEGEKQIFPRAARAERALKKRFGNRNVGKMRAKGKLVGFTIKP